MMAVTEEDVPVLTAEQALQGLTDSIKQMDYIVSVHIEQAKAIGEELRTLAAFAESLKAASAEPTIVLNIDNKKLEGMKGTISGASMSVVPVDEPFA